ncbi:MCE family protein [Mycobacterium sp. SMC-2]|uniref:MCE family protein n=1 Tax=Mycobacterium sp. SMC-2 TaxID=2857058 RepID=UPI0021B15C2F|nr:MCE family protein [Mycobacterium sp. SMC-2]UXA06184.1 MCE family protein [Mycobacterium sp. SMC-2]
MNRRRLVAVTAAVLVGLIIGGATPLIRQSYFAPKTVTAVFTTATGIYPGDEVRVAGVKVGNIRSIKPDGTQITMTLNVNHDVPIPADAKAVIVAQNLVAARYVQLAPAYESSGPTMPDGAVIPVDRTAVPVEWDEVKTQLMRLATDLGPTSGVSSTSVSRFIDSAANAMNGNGDKLRQTLAQLSGIGRILADGSGNIVDILKNLQTFVTALRDSNTQIVQFEDHFASLTSVLNGSRSDLDSALNDLSVAVGEVQRFIAGTRDKASEQVQRLANVTQTITDHRIDLENILHVAPNAFANGYNMYSPDTGSVVGAATFQNFANPLFAICGAITAVADATSSETGKLCAQYLGPGLSRFNFNYLPFPTDPYLMKSPDNIIYSDPKLAPGGAGPAETPPEIPPAVSAYTGLNGDVPPPPGYGQPPAVAPGPSAPDHLPAFPSPALYPGAPVSTPTSLSQMLLPADGPAS